MKLQIGVMGSAADLNYGKDLENIAEQLGREIAKQSQVLVFGAEKDYDSLSTAACRGAKEFGGTTLGVTYGKGKDIYQKDADIIICTGSERGGPRESVLVMSCDAIIGISGGSGTLTEYLVAYQANIPMIGMKGTGRVTDLFVDKYLDLRERRKLIGASSPREAVTLALTEGRKYRGWQEPCQVSDQMTLEETTDFAPQYEKRGGVLPVVVQDSSTKDVLMVGYVNQEAVEKSLKIGLATFWSTSRKELWTKGLTSGNTMKMDNLRMDCDQDAIVYLVTPKGGACHSIQEDGTARSTCFYRRLVGGRLWNEEP